MTAQADPVYLPIPSPARIEGRIRILLKQHAPARQSFLRPRVYRVPPRPADEGLVYGPDGTLNRSQASGLEIDLFA